MKKTQPNGNKSEANAMKRRMKATENLALIVIFMFLLRHPG